MQISSLEAVIYTIAFLVPGFVWSATLAMMVPSRTTAQHVSFLNYLTLSCLNHGLWSWALLPIFTTGFINSHPGWTGAFLFIEGFASPVALALVAAEFRQKRWVSRFLQKLGARTIDPIPTAWDWHFSRAKPYWAIVTLRNGSRIFGLFGYESFAGDDPNNHDLFLQRTYRLIGEGDYTEWAPVEDSAGVYITADEISVIEFKKMTEVDYDH
jgi:hypothetical protein